MRDTKENGKDAVVLFVCLLFVFFHLESCICVATKVTVYKVCFCQIRPIHPKKEKATNKEYEKIRKV